MYYPPFFKKRQTFEELNKGVRIGKNPVSFVDKKHVPWVQLGNDSPTSHTIGLQFGVIFYVIRIRALYKPETNDGSNRPDARSVQRPFGWHRALRTRQNACVASISNSKAHFRGSKERSTCNRLKTLGVGIESRGLVRAKVDSNCSSELPKYPKEAGKSPRPSAKNGSELYAPSYPWIRRSFSFEFYHPPKPFIFRESLSQHPRHEVNR